MTVSTHETSGTLREILHVVFKHKGKVTVIFLTVVLTVTIINILMNPVYEATAKIMVKYGRENIYVPTSPVSTGNRPFVFDASREERINSAVEIIKGRNLIESVLKEIGVNKIYPEIGKSKIKPLIAFKKVIKGTESVKKHSVIETASLKFANKLSVEAVKKSDIIQIKFQNKNPEIAAEVVNKLLDIFLEHYLDVYQQPRKYDFFDNQVALLKRKLIDAEGALEKFRLQNNITSLEEQKRLLLMQISELELDFAKTMSEDSEKKGKLLALTGYETEGSQGVKMGEETDFNPHAISAIKAKLTELELEEGRLRGKYNDNNLMLINIKKDIKKAQELLAREEKVYHEKAIATIEQNLNALKNKQKTQKLQLTDYKRQLDSINRVEMKHKELERDVQINEENYQLYLKHMEEARISVAMDTQKLANISIVKPGLTPIQPIKPKRILNIFFSILLGFFLSMGVSFLCEYFNHSFSKPDDVVKHLGLPVFATIPEMEKGKR